MSNNANRYNNIRIMKERDIETLDNNDILTYYSMRCVDVVLVIDLMDNLKRNIRHKGFNENRLTCNKDVL